MIFLGKRKHGLGQKRGRFDMHRKLARPGPEQITADTDVIADVEQLVELEIVIANCVLADVYLEAFTFLLQCGETRFALGANGHQSTSDSYVNTLRFKLLAREAVVRGANGGDAMGDRVLIRVCGIAQGFDLGQLLLAERIETALKF